MTDTPQIKGWCPGALRPMMSGDGLVVRVRPWSGRLTQEQADGLGELAQRYGNGLIDISNRANVQLRGIDPDRYPALLDALRSLALVDDDAAIESRRNILVQPFWQMGDDTDNLTQQLNQALTQADLPDMSAKFGFAIDAGKAPVLQQAPADIRVERSAAGDLIVCVDGRDNGYPVTPDQAIGVLIETAQFFLSGPYAGQRRLARMVDAGARLPVGFNTPRQAVSEQIIPGLYPAGALVALAFGQISGQALQVLAALGPLRVTPWRMLLVEGVSTMPQIEGIISTPDDPRLRVVACTGDPGCAQAHGETRKLAARLAEYVPSGQALHVSGCRKGCALPRQADLTITATSAGYDLVGQGKADDAPFRSRLSQQDVVNYFKGGFSDAS